MAAINEVGNRYGKLIVLERDFSKPRSNKNAYWLCQCDCGKKTIVLGTKLRNGETKSCGCLRREKAKENVVDITGQKFGQLTVLERNGSSNTGVAEWKCQCDCGNIVTVLGSNLRNGHTKSCGCYVLEQQGKIHLGDITGNRYGKLVALERLDKKRGSNYIWKCQCDCGKITEVDINSLTQGRVSSCGCLSMSCGELKIEQIFNKNNIKYISQKTFDTCRSPKTNRLFKFDFYIPEKNYLIEYDGKQHFSYENNNGWNNKENFEKNVYNDNIKNQWCKKNNIPLIRIPYTHLKDLCLKDLLLETSQFII